MSGGTDQGTGYLDDPLGINKGDTGDQEKKGMWSGAGNQAGAAQAGYVPSAGAFHSGVNSQAQASQSQLLDQLNQQAQGLGPSVATHQLQGANDQNVRQQAAMAAGNRGNPMAAMNAAQNAGTGSQALSGQAAAARAQEQLNAQAAAAGLAGQMQNQGFQGAGMQNAFGMGQAQMNQQGMEAFGSLQAQQQMAQNAQVAQLQAQREQEQNANRNALTGGIESGIGQGLMAMSDENMKTNVRDGGNSLHDFLDKLGAHEYEYKRDDLPGTSPGTHVSVMAQELEKSPTGRSAVVASPHGKMVDYKKLLPAMLAAATDAHKRLKSLETT